MTQHENTQDHEHTELEIMLAQQVQSYRRELGAIHQARQIMAAALLQLLPNEGDSVVVQLEDPILTDEADITAVCITREGDKLAIGQA